jgi:hypothetical protein
MGMQHQIYTIARAAHSSLVEHAGFDFWDPARLGETTRPMHRRLPLILRLLSTTQQTRPPGGNETRLLTLGSLPRDGRGLTDMLMVTTTVRLC